MACSSDRSSSPEVEELNSEFEAELEGAVGGENMECEKSACITERATENETDEAMDKFLQNSRRDLMYELRRIQHGERPVTGQSHRDNINRFLSKRLEVQAHTAGKHNVPANMDQVEEHRPEAVVVEVQGLFEQRPVSAVLQSPSFRRHLENIIRGSLSTYDLTVRRSTPPAQRSHQAFPAPSVPTPSHHESPARPIPARVHNTTPPLSERSSPAVENRSRSGSSESTQSTGSGNSASMNMIPPAPSLGPSGDNDQPDGRERLQLPIAIEEALHIQRETIVEEVSDLLHRRLVSSSLEGEFRGTLEVHMQQRQQQTGTDGERVRDFIHSIPHDPDHRRNDFAHLGLQPGGDNWDNVSVTSISATAVPYTQTNLHLSREMRALKAQVEEMKNMMKVSFDLQLDIQRAIRQEVAAVVSRATDDQAESAPSACRSIPMSDSHCLICLESHADSVLYQCGHMCLCYACGKHLMNQGAKCPVCRAPIRDIIRAYKCNME